MKTKFLLSLTVIICLTTFNAIAGQDRGGGDLCENRIKVISRDIQKWILEGGGEKLKLPADIPSAFYSNEMLKAIEHASIRCVSEGDIGHPVTINQTPKVCVYDKLVGSGEITCDSDKFSKISESDQYVLVHHEFAGLAGLENPEGSDSSYDISNQLSGFLENQVVKKLTINPSSSSFAVGEIRAYTTTRESSSGLITTIYFQEYIFTQKGSIKWLLLKYPTLMDELHKNHPLYNESKPDSILIQMALKVRDGVKQCYMNFTAKKQELVLAKVDVTDYRFHNPENTCNNTLPTLISILEE